MKPSEAIKYMRNLVVKKGKTIKSNSWQGNKPLDNMVEWLNITIPIDMNCDYKTECNPSLPWADEHFEERVGGIPLNPPPSHTKWARGTEKYFSGEEKFSHTYPERFWPKGLMSGGIRFKTGDLNDLINLLKEDRTTRQAYLPIWFPEDLRAALEGERVPCTIGYHFIIRDNKLYCNYLIRSCDVARHLKNDIYLAIKLADYIRNKVDESIKLGTLTFSVVSLHCFKGDIELIKKGVIK